MFCMPTQRQSVTRTRAGVVTGTSTGRGTRSMKGIITWTTAGPTAGTIAGARIRDKIGERDKEDKEEDEEEEDNESGDDQPQGVAGRHGPCALWGADPCTKVLESLELPSCRGGAKKNCHHRSAALASTTPSTGFVAVPSTALRFGEGLFSRHIKLFSRPDFLGGGDLLQHSLLTPAIGRLLTAHRSKRTGSQPQPAQTKPASPLVQTGHTLATQIETNVERNTVLVCR